MAAKSKNKMRTTKGGSPIIEMDVVANTSGGRTQRNTRKKAAVTTRGGTTYMVPVDRYGRVPEDALYEHFLDAGRWSRDGKRRCIRADLATTADKLHAPKDPKGWAPEELVKTGWWAAVNESDIVGVDDSTSAAFPTFDSIKTGMRAPIGKIALIMPEDRQKYVVQTLQNNFTQSELKRMTADHGLVIMEAYPGPGADGCYYTRQRGVETPTIYIKNTSGEDTITHEVIHHARASDPKRSDISKTVDRFDSEGYMIPALSASYLNLEEAATVAESTARTREPTTNLGYYTRLKGDARDLYNADRKLLTDGKPLRGKRAVDKINNQFEETAISQLKFTRGPRASEVVDQLRVNGQIKPRTTKKKTTGQGQSSAAKKGNAGAKKAGNGSSAAKRSSSPAKSSASKSKTGGRRK